MVTKIIGNILELFANALNILVYTITKNLDLSLNNLNANIPGLSVFLKVMMGLGVAVVFFCIITEAFQLVLSPFSGQARQGGFVTILRCVIAGLLVVFIFEFSTAVLEHAVQPFYEDFVKTAVVDESTRVSDIKAARDKCVELTGKPPEEVAAEYQSIKAQLDALKAQRAEVVKAGNAQAVVGFDQAIAVVQAQLDELEYPYQLAMKWINKSSEEVVLDLRTLIGSQFENAKDSAGESFLMSLIPVYGVTYAALQLYVTAIIIILLVRFVQIVLSLLMRYITFGLIIYMGPLCMGFAASPTTTQIPKLWAKTVLSQIILFMATSWGFSIMFNSLVSSYEGLTPFQLVVKIAFVLTFGKIILKMDEILNRLGFNTMPTVDSARSGLYGAAMLGMMAFRTFKGGGGRAPGKIGGEEKLSPVSMGRTGQIGVAGVKAGSQQAQAIGKFNQAIKNNQPVDTNTIKAAGLDPSKQTKGKVNLAGGVAQPDGKGGLIAPTSLQKMDGSSSSSAMHITSEKHPDYAKNANGDYVGKEGSVRGPSKDWNYARNSDGSLRYVDFGADANGNHTYGYMLNTSPTSSNITIGADGRMSYDFDGRNPAAEKAFVAFNDAYQNHENIDQSLLHSLYGKELNSMSPYSIETMDDRPYLASFDEQHNGYDIWLSSTGHDGGLSKREAFMTPTPDSVNLSVWDNKNGVFKMDDGMTIFTQRRR